MSNEDSPQVHEPQADRAPTPDEDQAADRAVTEVDAGAVREHETEMDRLGANVPGEGEIEPTSSV